MTNSVPFLATWEYLHLNIRNGKSERKVLYLLFFPEEDEFRKAFESLLYNGRKIRIFCPNKVHCTLK